MIVDSHVHLWDLARRSQPWIDPVTMRAIHRSFGLDDLRDTLGPAGVSGAVLVQVLNRPDETADFMRLAAQAPMIAGVVAWVDLAAGDLDDQIGRLRSGPAGDRLVGLRHQAQEEPEPPAWAADARVARGVGMLAGHQLTFDLMFTWRQLRAALELARTAPQVTFILDHCAKPPVSTGWGSPESAAWRRALHEAARLPNLTCKLSGLSTMAGADWTAADLEPFVTCVLEEFGPARVMFGSDWPVSLRGGGYGELIEVMETLLGWLTEPEREDVMSANARRIYRLAPAIACE